MFFDFPNDNKIKSYSRMTSKRAVFADKFSRTNRKLLMEHVLLKKIAKFFNK